MAELTPKDWRGAALARMRALIRQADPEIVETVKWKKPSNPAGVPVWEHTGIVCTGETYKDKVKLTFAKGASLEDPSGLFNSSLDGNTRRAIDIREGDEIGEAAFKALVKAAVALNVSNAGAPGHWMAPPRWWVPGRGPADGFSSVLRARSRLRRNRSPAVGGSEFAHP